MSTTDRIAGGRELPSGDSAPPAGPAQVLALQRSIGNHAVVRSLQRWDWRDVADPLGVSSAIGGLLGFIDGLRRQDQFKRSAHSARRRPIWSAEWDAWGHALCAASSASFGGEGHAHAYGQGYEEIREILSALGLEHDSYDQDSHNQAVGRSIAAQTGGGMSGDETARACTQAYLQGRLLIGPAREAAWLPWCGDTTFFPVRRHEGSAWFSAEGVFESAPENWVEAVDPGERGLSRDSERRPTTPLPPG